MQLTWTVVRKSIAHTKGRLALIALAVAFGVYMLLAFAAFTNATTNKDAESWKQSVMDTWSNPAKGEATSPHITIYRPGIDFVMNIGNTPIDVFYVDTATSTTHPELHGLTWPDHGQYVLSQGVHELISASGNSAIMPRFGTEDLGPMPRELTNGPDDLIAIIGKDLSGVEDVIRVTSFEPIQNPGQDPNQIVLIIGLVVVMFPVLLLISISAGLGSMQREQRYAALRLVGATSRQTRQILVAEAMVGALAGYVIGAVLFALTRPALAEIPLTGGRYWADSITVGPLVYLVVAVVAIIIVLGANLWGLRAITTTPLGVVRRQNTEKRPSAVRLSGIAIALGIFVFLWLTAESDRATQGEMLLFLASVMVLMFGLVIAGPWLIYWMASLSARWAKSAPAVIGNNYVRAHSGRIARSVSGIILALFAGTFFITSVSEVHSVLRTSHVSVLSQMPDTTVFITGLEDDAVTTIYEAIADSYTAGELLLTADPVTVPYIARAWAVLDCADAATYANVACENDGVVGINFWGQASEPGAIVEATDVSAFADTVNQDYDAHVDDPSSVMLVPLSSAGDIEQLRTLLAGLDLGTPGSFYVLAGAQTTLVIVDPTITVMANLVYAGIAFTLAIAIISMLISTYAGILERRRSLFALRLSGMQVKQIAAMMLVEAVFPLAIIAGLTSVLGYSSGWLLMDMRSMTLDASFSPKILLALAIALVLAVAAILALTPTMRRVTAPENNARE
ncbi:MAG: hypothetical protein GX483_01485 [Actinomycetaceae bacterium]|nr:hypothetical protein [Actinomycetaceae bacterium]